MRGASITATLSNHVEGETPFEAAAAFSLLERDLFMLSVAHHSCYRARKQGIHLSASVISALPPEKTCSWFFNRRLRLARAGVPPPMGKLI
jgi:hypothetical protein